MKSEATQIIDESVFSLKRLVDSFVNNAINDRIANSKTIALKQAIETLEDKDLISSTVRKKMGEVDRQLLLNASEELVNLFSQHVKGRLYEIYLPTVKQDLRDKREELDAQKIMGYFGLKPQNQNNMENEAPDRVVSNAQIDTKEIGGGWVQCTVKDLQRLVNEGKKVKFAAQCPADKNPYYHAKDGKVNITCVPERVAEGQKRRNRE